MSNHDTHVNPTSLPYSTYVRYVGTYVSVLYGVLVQQLVITSPM